MLNDYLNNQTHLSQQTLGKYKSELRIYFVWVKDNLKNKNCTDIKKKDFLRYLNWLTNRNMSDSAIKLKKSSVSAFNKFIEEYYEDEFPMFRNYVTSSMQVVKTGDVHEKKPLTEEELQYLYSELEKMGEWQKIAYLKFTYSTGCRRSESAQLLKEVVTCSPIIKEIDVFDEDGIKQKAEAFFYRTHDIRCKGRSKVGKVRKLTFGKDVMDALNKWLEIRGDDDCPYMFVHKNKNGVTTPINGNTFNTWCSGLFTKIVGRRVHPHLLRESRATNLVAHQGKSIEVAQKLLGHESSETTNIYVIREDDGDASEAFI